MVLKNLVVISGYMPLNMPTSSELKSTINKQYTCLEFNFEKFQVDFY